MQKSERQEISNAGIARATRHYTIPVLVNLSWWNSFQIPFIKYDISQIKSFLIFLSLAWLVAVSEGPGVGLGHDSVHQSIAF